ncbi:MAG: polyprenol monophosphomannose synthase [Solirubrobacterales bacterium]|nr:polyprenol monophosphomannose synthase [Solirubrobacterales bacterium]
MTPGAANRRPRRRAKAASRGDPPDGGLASGRVTAPIWLTIPTYNEAVNLERIVAAARAELQRIAAGGYRILVVDDNSPDGTGAIADSLAAGADDVEVLHRPAKDGLGRAYLAGFALALAAGAEMVIEMDADFSHDPRYLPALLDAIHEADLVIGSRYVPGGGVRDWGLLRQLVSRGGGLYARAVLGFDVRDPTAGFKCIRKRVLEAIDLPSVRADGYVFQIEVTYRAVLAGFRVREVPIVFADRAAGRSKMSARIALEAMWLAPAIKRDAPAAVARAAAADPSPINS